MNLPPEEAGLGEPDEDSTENVVESLRRYDRELARSGKIDIADTEDYLLTNHVAPDDLEILEAEARTEQEKVELEDFTRLIRSTLSLVGLADPGSVTPESVSKIDQELLEQLDPYNLESLFFEVARKVHLRLGEYEPVTWRRVLEQAMPANKPVVDLDLLQLEQRLKAFSYLIDLGVDPNEISNMVKSGSEMGVTAPSRRQNVNRMAYFFEEEPLFMDFVEKLRNRAKKPKRFGEQLISAERAVRMGQIVLRLQGEKLEKKRRIQEGLRYSDERKWDSIDYDVYRKMKGRIKVSLAISNLIRAEMRIESVDDFLNEL
ncbi:hypothetical protein KW794_01000 [Candidatus Saccharibacteria bacterium]|nr:hypothetical protein [Candidatus Saccharibacteria bacterium]